MLYAVLGKPERDTSLVGLGWPRGMGVLLLVSGDLDVSMSMCQTMYLCCLFMCS